MSADERGVIGLSDGQNVQMKSQRSPCVIIGDPRHTVLTLATDYGKLRQN